MRGVPWPPDAPFDRETSNEYGTPASNIDDIPIDPALAGPPIDPALQQWPGAYNQEQIPFPQTPLYSPISPQRRDYSQGPQGDPFAPAPPTAYFAIEEPIAPEPQKPVKKKRKPKREPICGHCNGKAKNRQGEPELIISCAECGRSGHPSCMQLKDVAETISQYPWTCVECKICEICHEKGDDSRILFCDSCDRGWHMDCLTPPFESTPPGKWFCPICTGQPAGVCGPPEPEEAEAEAQPEQPVDTNDYGVRASSVASSSRSQLPVTPGPKSHKKGKRRAVVTDESEDVEVDVEGSDTPIGPRGRERRKTFATRKRRAAEGEQTPSPPRRVKINGPKNGPKRTVRLRLPPQGQESEKEKTKSRKGKEKEEVSDDSPTKGMFDDILSEAERDTTKTNVTASDKAKFERARLAAEAKLAPPPKPPAHPADTPTPGPSTRPLRSAGHLILATPITPGPGRSRSPSPATPSLPVGKTPHLRIQTIRFGRYDIQTWYDAPFPEEYANIPDGRMWICEFCLKYMKSRFTALRHQMKCKVRHPPGDEIYRDGRISIFEVDGRRNKIYCQNLCLLSKMFLDHKSLFYDVEPFLFYVMTEVDDIGARFVGYFSKEKRSLKDYNVSCIMTLPVRQRQGWGNLLIDFSYLLSKKEQRPGSPEKPLSGLGALGYRNYWTLAVMRYLQTARNHPRLEDISRATCMTLEDVYNTLSELDMIHVRGTQSPPKPRPLPGQSIKFPRGRKNGVARRHLVRTQTQDDDAPQGPFAPPTHYDVRWDRRRVDAYLAKWAAKGYFTIKPEKLKWSPFLIARVRKTDTIEPPAPVEDVDADAGGDADVELSDAPDDDVDADADERDRDEDEDEVMRDADDNDDDELPQSIAASETPRNVNGRTSSRSRTRGRTNGVAASPSTWSASPSTITLRSRPSRSPTKRPSQSQPQSQPPPQPRLRSHSRSPVKRSTPRQPPAPASTSSTARRLRSQGGAEPVGELPTPLAERTTRRTRARAEEQARARARDTMEDDAALAKRLAQEEMRPLRSLRSRSFVGAGGAGANGIGEGGTGSGREKRRAPPGRASPKKRRRVESSPEPEPDPEPEPEEVPDPEPEDEDADAEGEPEQPDVMDVDADADAEAEGEGEGEDVLPAVNGHAASDTTRVGSPTQVSRQSAPSDDTLFVVGGEGGAVKGAEGGRVEAVAAADVDEDADAEGEDDEDAEGEPDDGL